MTPRSLFMITVVSLLCWIIIFLAVFVILLAA